MQHTVAGVLVDHTRTTRDVLVHQTVLVQANAAITPPDLLRLLERGLVKYQRERRGRDDFRTWMQILDAVPSVQAWRKKLGMSWEQLARDWGQWQPALEACLAVSPAFADCEDLSSWLAVSLPLWSYCRLAAPACQEVYAPTWWGKRKLAGWHALTFCVGVTPLPGVVAPGRDVWIFRGIPDLKPGEKYRLIDPSWMGGMARPDEGAYRANRR